MDLAIFSHTETWISLLTLTVMEIVLGIDNIIFISIISGRLPKEQQPKARSMGIIAALGIRIVLLIFIQHITEMTEPLFHVMGLGFGGRELIMLAGGLFLISKSTMEIHEKMEGQEEDHTKKIKHPTFTNIVFQVIMIDIVFSFDSIITAVGLANDLIIMIAAVVISMIIMLMSASRISAFIEKHPTMKMLALSFLLMIGFLLILEGCSVHVEKGYVYFAMAFSILVEVLNMRVRKGRSVNN